MAILQAHMFSDQWKAYEGLRILVIMLALPLTFPKIRLAKTLKIVVLDNPILV